MTESTYDALDEWLEDVVASTDRELETDRPRPDFAEVVARAHAEDPRRVTAEQLEEVRALAAVIPIQARASESSSSHSAPLDGDFGEALAAQDCSSTAAADDLDGDVALLNAGFATIGPVADAPAQPAG